MVEVGWQKCGLVSYKKALTAQRLVGENNSSLENHLPMQSSIEYLDMYLAFVAPDSLCKPTFVQTEITQELMKNLIDKKKLYWKLKL